MSRNPLIEEIARRAATQGGPKRAVEKAANKMPKNQARYLVNLFVEVAGPEADKLTTAEVLLGAMLIEHESRAAA
jgi:hypothetical protein